MDTNPQGVSQDPIAPANEAASFARFWDAPEGAAEPQKVTESPAPQQAQEHPKGEEKAAPEATAEPEQESEGLSFSSIDEYLSKQKLEREAFYSLKVPVKVDGRDELVPLSELAKGHELKQASYNRMQEAAAKRAEIERAERETLGAAMRQAEQAQALFTLAQNELTSEFQRVDWNALRQSDPARYAQLYTDFQVRNQQIAQSIQQIETYRQQQAQAAEQQRLQALPAEREKLLAAIPEWRDPQKFKAAQEKISSYAKARGFSDAELAQIFDSRYVQVLHDAQQWREFQAAKPERLKQVRSAPAMARPGARQERDGTAAAYQSAREQLVSNPRSEDAQARAFSFFA